MKLRDIEDTLNTNMSGISYINDIKVFGAICKSMDGDDIPDSMTITMDDPVITQLRIWVKDGELMLELSQMETPKPAPKVRASYFSNQKDSK